MCRWSAQSGLVMVRHRSWSFCSSPEDLPFNFWLPGVLWVVRSYRRLSPGCSLPRHLHRPPGRVNSFLFLWEMRAEVIGQIKITAEKSIYWTKVKWITTGKGGNTCLITFNHPGKGNGKPNQGCKEAVQWFDYGTYLFSYHMSRVSQYLYKTNNDEWEM